MWGHNQESVVRELWAHSLILLLHRHIDLFPFDPGGIGYIRPKGQVAELKVRHVVPMTSPGILWCL